MLTYEKQWRRRMRSVSHICKIACLILLIVWAMARPVVAWTGLPDWARTPFPVAGPIMFIASMGFALAEDEDNPGESAGRMIIREAENQGLTDIIVRPDTPGVRRLTARDRDGRRNLYEYDPETRNFKFIRPLGKKEK